MHMLILLVPEDEIKKLEEKIELISQKWKKINHIWEMFCVKIGKKTSEELIFVI